MDSSFRAGRSVEDSPAAAEMPGAMSAPEEAAAAAALIRSERRTDRVNAETLMAHPLGIDFSVGFFSNLFGTSTWILINTRSGSHYSVMQHKAALSFIPEGRLDVPAWAGRVDCTCLYRLHSGP
jgi:hypothetical protein